MAGLWVTDAECPECGNRGGIWMDADTGTGPECTCGAVCPFDDDGSDAFHDWVAAFDVALIVPAPPIGHA